MTEADGYNQGQAEDFFREAFEKQNEGKLDEAIGLYKKSIDFYPTAEAYTYLGWALSFKGLYDDAILECQKAIAMDPDYGNPYNDIGAYLIEQGKWDEAVNWLEKAVKAPRYSTYCYPHYNLGRIWEKKGDWFRASNSYQASLNANPDYTLARKALSRLKGMMN